MSRPTVSPIAEQMYEGLGPLTFDDERNNYALLHFCQAFIGSLQNVETVVRYDEAANAPGWSMVMDVDRAPYVGLPWLGQLVGVTTPEKMVGETQAQHDARTRAYIRDTGGFDRGTPAAIVGAVQQYLTPPKQVILIERDSSPYHFQVRVREGQTPTEEWPTTNLVANGGLETDMTSWSGTNIVRSTVKALYGSASLRLITAGGVNDSAQTFITSGFAVGDVLSFSCWVNPDTTVTMNMQINQNNNVPTLLDFSEGPAVVCPANVWTRLTHTRAVIAGVTSVYMYITTFNIQPITTMYLDGAQIEKHSKATPYVETNGAIASRPAGSVNMRKAIDAQKPAGLQYEFFVTPDWVYDDLDARAATYNALDALYSSYDQMEGAP